MKLPKLLLMAAVLTMGLLTGCESSYPAAETHATETVQETETETDTVLETVPETVMETTGQTVSGSAGRELAVFESSENYTIQYDDTLFEADQAGGFDELVYKQKAFSSSPLVFFAAIRLRPEEVTEVTEEIFGEDAQEVTIGAEAYPALALISAEEDEKGKLEHDQYLVLQENGEALFFELQWYEYPDEPNMKDEMQRMLDSLMILPANASESSETAVPETAVPETVMPASGD